MVYAHNSAFDNKFLLKVLNITLLTSKSEKFPEVNLLGEDTEKIKMVTGGQCCFKDSYAVFESSLDDLCSIKSTVEINKMLQLYLMSHSHFRVVLIGMTPTVKKRAFDIINDKGHYHYEYFTNKEVLLEKDFPPLEAFTNTLANKDPDPEKWKKAIEVFDIVGCRDLIDNSKLYNIMDVINLAVIFESIADQKFLVISLAWASVFR